MLWKQSNIFQIEAKPKKKLNIFVNILRKPHFFSVFFNFFSIFLISFQFFLISFQFFFHFFVILKALFKSITKSDLVKNSISTLLVICDFICNHILLEREEILSGTRKNQLAQWWLNLIQDRVKEFLEHQGFDFLAVPVDYIDDPPKSLEAVQDNLKIVKSCLAIYKDYVRPSTSFRRTNSHLTQVKNNLVQQSMVQLVEGCRKDIYDKLEEFSNRAKEVINSILGEEVEITEELVKRKELPDHVTFAMKDVLYVKKMKELEYQNKPAESKDIVPVIGLVLNNFFRFENELETVLEVWEGRLVSAQLKSATYIKDLPRRHFPDSTELN